MPKATTTSSVALQRSIVELTAKLVQIPSRAGVDPVEPLLDFLDDWLGERGLPSRRLHDAEGRLVGLYLRLASAAPGPVICLDACLDTAPFGDERAWTYPPTSGQIEGGRLLGRGAADCKVAMALFSHLLVELTSLGDLPCGEVYAVFDAYEHTGEFAGIKCFLDAVPRLPDAVLIGYPGNDKVVVGSRGFLRARLTVAGQAAHSGGTSRAGINAALKAARLTTRLHERPLPGELDPYFRFGPKLTVTAVHGGEGFSVVPDRCELNVDFRLTPNVGRDVAARWIETVVREIDTEHPSGKPTAIEWLESWPAYRVDEESPLVTHFLAAAQEVFDRPIPPRISGPSNIGNFLAARGIPALAGFGVSYSNVHGTDESIEIASILPVYETYRRALDRILSADLSQSDTPRAVAPRAFG